MKRAPVGLLVVLLASSMLLAGYEGKFDLTRLIEIDTNSGDISNHGPIGECAPVAMTRDQAHVYVLTSGSGVRRIHYFSRVAAAVRGAGGSPAGGSPRRRRTPSRCGAPASLRSS